MRIIGIMISYTRTGDFHFAGQALSAHRCRQVTGMVMKAEINTLVILTEDGLENPISFNDIREITSESDIFETEWEYA